MSLETVVEYLIAHDLNITALELLYELHDLGLDNIQLQQHIDKLCQNLPQSARSRSVSLSTTNSVFHDISLSLRIQELEKQLADSKRRELELEHKLDHSVSSFMDIDIDTEDSEETLIGAIFTYLQKHKLTLTAFQLLEEKETVEPTNEIDLDELIIAAKQKETVLAEYEMLQQQIVEESRKSDPRSSLYTTHTSSISFRKDHIIYIERGKSLAAEFKRLHETETNPLSVMCNYSENVIFVTLYSLLLIDDEADPALVERLNDTLLRQLQNGGLNDPEVKELIMLFLGLATVDVSRSFIQVLLEILHIEEGVKFLIDISDALHNAYFDFFPFLSILIALVPEAPEKVVSHVETLCADFSAHDTPFPNQYFTLLVQLLFALMHMGNGPEAILNNFFEVDFKDKSTFLLSRPTVAFVSQYIKLTGTVSPLASVKELAPIALCLNYLRKCIMLLVIHRGDVIVDLDWMHSIPPNDLLSFEPVMLLDSEELHDFAGYVNEDVPTELFSLMSYSNQLLPVFFLTHVSSVFQEMFTNLYSYDPAIISVFLRMLKLPKYRSFCTQILIRAIKTSIKDRSAFITAIVSSIVFEEDGWCLDDLEGFCLTVKLICKPLGFDVYDSFVSGSVAKLQQETSVECLKAAVRAFLNLTVHNSSDIRAVACLLIGHLIEFIEFETIKQDILPTLLSNAQNSQSTKLLESCVACLTEVVRHVNSSEVYMSIYDALRSIKFTPDGHVASLMCFLLHQVLSHNRKLFEVMSDPLLLCCFECYNMEEAEFSPLVRMVSQLMEEPLDWIEVEFAEQLYDHVVAVKDTVSKEKHEQSRKVLSNFGKAVKRRRDANKSFTDFFGFKKKKEEDPVEEEPKLEIETEVAEDPEDGTIQFETVQELQAKEEEDDGSLTNAFKFVKSLL
ncbi:hypothetical protein PCE1_001889 [Barthelona sp. PCE]